MAGFENHLKNNDLKIHDTPDACCQGYRFF